MRTKFPRKVGSNFEGYDSFIELLRLLQQSSDPDFTISFENTEVFEANLSGILGAIIDSVSEQQKIVELVDIHSTIRDVFELNNFIINSVPNLNSRHKGTVIPFMKFTQYKDIEFMDYVKNEMLSKPDFPKHSKMLGKKINESIFELFDEFVVWKVIPYLRYDVYKGKI